MNTITRLENDVTHARRERDQKRLGVLTLLLAKIQRIAKDDGNRTEITDADVIAGVSRYRKEVEEMRAALLKAGRTTEEQDFELEVVTGYLPSQLSEEELDAEIEKVLADTDRTKKAMGAVMKHLNSNFLGRFDPKKANALIGAKLA